MTAPRIGARAALRAQRQSATLARLALATGASVVAAAVLHRLAGSLPAPPLDVDGLAAWAAEQGTAAAAMALLRLGGLALAVYAATVSAVAFLGALTRSVVLLRFAHRASAGLLPRLAAGALTLGVASSALAAAPAGARSTAAVGVTVPVVAAAPTGFGVGMHLGQPPDAAPAGPTATIPLQPAVDAGPAIPAAPSASATVTSAGSGGHDGEAAAAVTGSVTMHLEPGPEPDAAVRAAAAPEATTGPAVTMRLLPGPGDTAAGGGDPAGPTSSAAAERATPGPAGQPGPSPAVTMRYVTEPDEDAGAVMHLETAPAESDHPPTGGVGLPPAASNPGDVASTTAVRAEAGSTWTVRPGDHLWAIAEAVVDQTSNGEADDATIGRYWQSLVELNRSRLADPGNADLLFTGQVMLLPPLPDAA